MRERLDKSYPNHYNTANAVCESIKKPVTEQRLIETIDSIEKQTRSSLTSHQQNHFAIPHVPSSNFQ